jgi:ribosomal L7/L12-like protein
MTLGVDPRVQAILEKMAKNNDQFVVVDRLILGKLLNLFRDSVEDQGPIAIKLFDALLEQIEPFITPYSDFMSNGDYTLYLVSADEETRRRNIDMIKLVRQYTNLGLKEAKDVVDNVYSEYGDYHSTPILKSRNMKALLGVVSRIRGFGFHVVIELNYEVIYDSRKDDGSDLAASMPVPTI